MFKKFNKNKEDVQSKKDRAKKVLSHLRCNPYDQDITKLTEFEVSLDEELLGIVAAFEVQMDNSDGAYDYMSVSRYNDGRLGMYFSLTNRDLKQTRDLVDRYSEILGEDIMFAKEFTSTDLSFIREEENVQIRTWELTYFSINIGSANNESGQTTYVLVDEKEV